MTRAAVLSPVLLVASVVAWAVSLFAGLNGLTVALDSTPDADSASGSFALAVAAGAAALGLWLAAVVTSVVGVARARRAPRAVAGVTLFLALGAVPLALLVGNVVSWVS
ncbi:hypothetical protein GCM10027047_14700 [Rhodococcus aerolatus]